MTDPALPAGTGTQRSALHVGAPMWTLPGWRGQITPARSPRNQDLHWYASWCNAVEGNTTFYATPSSATVQLWAEATPPTFKFCFKLPREMTHHQRLSVNAQQVREFLTRLEPLHDRLGPLWVQLPPSFGPENIGNLRRFLSALPREFRWAVELRHPNFEANGSAERQANDLLFEADVDRTLFDSRALFAGPCTTDDEQDAWQKKPRLRVRPLALGRHPTIRFVGQNGREANRSFWLPWVSKVAGWIADGREPFVFFHTPDNNESPTMAREFHRAVANDVATLDDLPPPKPHPGQKTIFDR